jgi:hypothetical protein
LGWALKQTCSPPWGISNVVFHFTCKHQGWVDSRLLVVKSKTVNLTPGPSFNHNLCCTFLNGIYEAIFNICTSRPFQRYKNISKRGVLTPIIELWIFRSPRGLPSPHFGNVNVILTLFQNGVATFNYCWLQVVTSVISITL